MAVQELPPVNFSDFLDASEEDDDIIVPTEEEISELYPQDEELQSLLFWADGPYRAVPCSDYFTISMGGPVGYPTVSNVPWIRIDGAFDNIRGAQTHAARIHKAQPAVAVGVIRAGSQIVFPLCSSIEQQDALLLQIYTCLDDETRAKEIDMALRHREAKRVTKDTEEFIRVKRRLVFTGREDLLPTGNTPTLPRLPGEKSEWEVWKAEHPDLYEEGLKWESPISM